MDVSEAPVLLLSQRIVESVVFGAHGLLALTDSCHGLATEMISGWKSTSEGGLEQRPDGPQFPSRIVIIVGIWMVLISTINFALSAAFAQVMIAILVGGIQYTRSHGSLKDCPCWMRIPSAMFYLLALSSTMLLGSGLLTILVAVSPALGWLSASILFSLCAQRDNRDPLLS
eukprot:TRINITY_DN68573_c0_g1_i1.p1 TRINITY_DN68573_c0_g1~~TRINITY_DN68573_c0_g1_i1.p1  ORF type:complete len:172 (-),score=21.20 TRINITY_DN68573_c0_g1_i1:16-531(-)